MANEKTIILKYSVDAGKIPTDTSLSIGELAVNAADARIYTKKTNNTIVDITSPRIGTTAERPINKYLGEQFYDTSLKKPIWWNGHDWSDSTGSLV